MASRSSPSSPPSSASNSDHYPTQPTSTRSTKNAGLSCPDLGPPRPPNLPLSSTRLTSPRPPPLFSLSTKPSCQPTTKSNSTAATAHVLHWPSRGHGTQFHIFAMNVSVPILIQCKQFNYFFEPGLLKVWVHKKNGRVGLWVEDLRRMFVGFAVLAKQNEFDGTCWEAKSLWQSQSRN
ncbi:hypothetical protein RchiOBHm_Chr3g0476351 [Rosa chinensis]|uniref:Uncharacterized protein n=1 Tax=Rosa chinensis TaxID=74649 RepID=A0A2P6RCL5_ROSCH|nr:hypothetical protein RchiOBHm_Chr3g0476351 [Rosa chinensis]